MTTNIYLRHITFGILAALLLVPALALAQSASTSTPISATIMARAKEKAGREIDRRVKALTELSARVSGMTKVTAELKQSISANVQNQVTSLSTLKTKIEANTDGATLRIDIQSITQSYRIYALVMPQTRIAAAADREATLINMLVGLGTKLQARLEALQAAGTDVTALGQMLTEMGVALGTAQTHAQNAISAVIVLTPDEGDKTKMKANTDALQGARKEVQAAHQDIVTARKHAETIIKGLRALETATTTLTQ